MTTKENIENMLWLARKYLEKANDDYDVQIPVEKFLAEYRLIYSVGYNTSTRIFDDFGIIGWFKGDGSGEKFKIDPSIRQNKHYGRDSNYESYNVVFPEPKAKTEESQ